MNNSKDFLLIEMLVKLTAISKLLVDKGVLTDYEIQTAMVDISKSISEEMKNIIVNNTDTKKNN